MLEKIIIFSVVVIFTSILASGWDHYALEPDFENFEGRAESSKLSNNTEYCYHFTWMGTKFNNRTFKNIRNKTCNQYFKDRKTLCINPMVATFNGNEPDIDYILNKHATEATCRLTQGQVCVRYTVTNNGLTSYQTRYCSMVNVEMEGPLRSGCVTEKRGSELIEVCVCRSQPGPKGICNSGHGLAVAKTTMGTLVLLGIYLMFLK